MKKLLGVVIALLILSLAMRGYQIYKDLGDAPENLEAP